MRLTERDIEIIQFINEFGFCEMNQIEEKFFLNKPRNYEIMRRLVKNGFVNHERIFFRRPGIYYASAKGSGYTDLPVVDRLLTNQYIHQISIIKVYLKLQQLYPDASWISERRLKHEKFYDGIGKTGHISDGIFLFPDGRRIAIEVEMSVKGKNRIEKILREYGADLSIKEVWYYCSKRVISAVTSVATKMPFVKIFSLEECLS